jgi:hypothetical protein
MAFSRQFFGAPLPWRHTRLVEHHNDHMTLTLNCPKAQCLQAINVEEQMVLKYMGINASV